ncbi:hypothetical protein TSUD_254370 [Trifolium subterraneum]|uniref:Pentatricopeptide repeat-containing protein n=1 Tax=Trifolium subterraneum TaxID=3900 RepID=A0A2Z6NGK0_TRISU|nr:hypothetical protein TSUD_254370 [Trifolium subterraneum]
MPERVWLLVSNVMINGYMKSGRTDLADELFCRMPPSCKEFDKLEFDDSWISAQWGLVLSNVTSLSALSAIRKCIPSVAV